ncbi:adenylyl-sulfate kinase [Candidatus Sulfidibacterium hydrothermale]|uniref:adenylyl-sulfate kinase n=1 Tax=Candidatus Sulfidibacterium hydrothermale TaxID=2875962 RepID=UPI001F0A46BD|nr:adenylyl-sulfate kinase [Candidatus Sulfidibacterium hydrothermale]UBM62467.1 adenylyl-sulfate kinase [Candidatus Sulfidibacterium hydrothermale]
MNKNNIHTVFDKIKDRREKEIYLKQRAKVIWFTGLSGSGKTTLASLLEKRLFELNYFCQILDGDNVRSGINKNLQFTDEDRIENIRRIAEVSKLFMNCGIILLCSFISPTNQMRKMAKEIIGEEDFLEIFVDTPLEVCEQRDPKGLYKKARTGEIKNFTGISAPFEAPQKPFLRVDNTHPDIDRTVQHMLKKILPEIKFDPLKVL